MRLAIGIVILLFTFLVSSLFAKFLLVFLGGFQIVGFVVEKLYGNSVGW